MVRFGISAKNTYGVPIPVVRKIAKEIGRDHELAVELWASGIHEARILATIVEDPKAISPSQMDKWAKDFDSWDVCDQACMNLFRYTKYAYSKAAKWAKDKREFVRRAGFALIAALASGDKKASDKDFEKFFPFITRYSTDDRNFVRKAVNWALRQIGKRNKALNVSAIKLSREVLRINSRSARWIAQDSLRELTSRAVAARLK